MSTTPLCRRGCTRGSAPAAGVEIVVAMILSLHFVDEPAPSPRLWAYRSVLSPGTPQVSAPGRDLPALTVRVLVGWLSKGSCRTPAAASNYRRKGLASVGPSSWRRSGCPFCSPLPSLPVKVSGMRRSILPVMGTPSISTLRGLCSSNTFFPSR